MSNDIFHQLYYHLIWTTRNRLPLPESAMQEWLNRTIVYHTEKRNGKVLASYVMPDHVHLLVSLPPNNLPQFIGQVKGASAHDFNKEWTNRHLLQWQNGYGVFSLRESDTPAVIAYIENQEIIHANREADSLLELTVPSTNAKTSSGNSHNDTSDNDTSDAESE